MGGGIVGTSIAKTLSQTLKNQKIFLLEKENELGLHQSSHNSNVIHAGIYYKKNSLKSKLCLEGLNLIYKYAEEKQIPVKKIGKLIIAKDNLEIIRLKTLYKRAKDNSVPNLELISDWSKIRDIQPNLKGLQAIWSPNTGNIDWKTVVNHLSQDFKSFGGEIIHNFEVEALKKSSDSLYPIVIKEKSKENLVLAKYVILSRGLQSGDEKLLPFKDSKKKHVSFRVNYQKMVPSLTKFIKTNIYGMPEIDLPFLGTHISPDVYGCVYLGPCAVPALKTEGYE